MRSLVITTPATDRTLLTIDELRQAAGVTDGSQDDQLIALEARIAAAITSACNVAVGSGADPTLRKERLTETIYYNYYNTALSLSRRHNVSIVSLTLNGSAVSNSELTIDGERGQVVRLSGGFPLPLWGYSIVVVYDAGFDTIPGDLKQAALDYFRSVLAESNRDPFVKSVSDQIDGVMTETKEFWVGSLPGGGPVPTIVAGQLKRFKNYVVS